MIYLQSKMIHAFAGAGVSVKPIGFLVVRMNDVRLISTAGNHLAERMVDIAPQFMDKLEGILRRNKGDGDLDDTIY